MFYLNSKSILHLDKILQSHKFKTCLLYLILICDILMIKNKFSKDKSDFVMELSLIFQKYQNSGKELNF